MNLHVKMEAALDLKKGAITFWIAKMAVMKIVVRH